MGSSATRRGLEWQTTGSGEGLGAVLVVKVGGGAPIYVDGEEMETSAESLGNVDTPRSPKHCVPPRGKRATYRYDDSYEDLHPEGGPPLSDPQGVDDVSFWAWRFRRVFELHLESRNWNQNAV